MRELLRTPLAAVKLDGARTSESMLSEIRRKPEMRWRKVTSSYSYMGSNGTVLGPVLGLVLRLVFVVLVLGLVRGLVFVVVVMYSRPLTSIDVHILTSIYRLSTSAYRFDVHIRSP